MSSPVRDPGIPNEHPAITTEQLCFILDALPWLVCYLDPLLHYRYINRSYQRWFGVTPADVVGKHITEVIGFTAYELGRTIYETALAGQAASWELVVPYKFESGTRHVRGVLTPHTDAQGSLLGLVGIVDDITVQRQLEASLHASNEQLATMAATDELTGLANRRAFLAHLSEAYQHFQKSGTSCSLILLDIDYFKAINDTFGHPVGDTVLQHVAHILQQEARTTDVVARYGGEEFVLLLPGTQLSQAVACAERMRTTIETTQTNRLSVTASFGVVTFSQGMMAATTILEVADGALYRAKAEGRNRVIAIPPED